MTEGAWKTVWRKAGEFVFPVCPDSSDHSIGPSLPELIGWVDPTETVIKEESIETGGSFQAQTLAVESAPNSTGSKTISFPFNVSVLALEFDSEEVHRDDTISLIVGKDTPIGIVSQTVLAPVTYTTSSIYQPDDNITYQTQFFNCLATTSETPALTSTLWDYGFKLPVSSTVTLNTNIGNEIKVSGEDLGRVLEVQSESIVTEFGPSSSLNVGSPVLQSVYKIKDYEIGKPKVHTIGTTKIGASGVPKFVPITVEYNNLSMTLSKKLIGKVEFLH